MAKAHQYYMPSGYYAGSVEDRGLLPGNSTCESPEIIEGHVPRWTGTAWEQVENHEGEEGYVDGLPHTIKKYGPLPEGWSKTPPPPTAEKIAKRRKVEVLARLNEIDIASVRPLRAIAQGDTDQEDKDKLAVLDAEAAALRAELAALGVI